MFISLQQYTALRAIQVEWLNTARSYTDRVPNFFNPANTGGLNGSAHLVPGTSALDDEAIDDLYGGDDLDWYLAALSEDVVEALEEIGGVEEVATNLAV